MSNFCVGGEKCYFDLQSEIGIRQKMELDFPNETVETVIKSYTYWTGKRKVPVITTIDI